MSWSSSPISHICDFGIRPRGKTHNWNKEIQTKEAGKKNSCQMGYGQREEEKKERSRREEAEKKETKTWNSLNSRRHCKRHAQLNGGVLLLPTLHMTTPFLWGQNYNRFLKWYVWYFAVLQGHQLSLSVGAAAEQGIVNEAFSLEQTLQGEISPCKWVCRHYLTTIVSKSPVFSLLRRVCLYLREQKEVTVDGRCNGLFAGHSLFSGTAEFCWMVENSQAAGWGRCPSPKRLPKMLPSDIWFRMTRELQRQSLLVGNADSSNQSPFRETGWFQESGKSKKEKLLLWRESTCGESIWRLGTEKTGWTWEAEGWTCPDQPGWAGVGLSVPLSRTVLVGTAETELGVQGKAQEKFHLGFGVEQLCIWWIWVRRLGSRLILIMHIKKSF